MTIGRIVWFDYLTSEPAKAQAFFEALFGWTAHTITLPSGPYTIVVNDGRPIAGYLPPLRDTPIYRLGEPYSHWLPQLEIANGHDTAAQVKRLGAKMHREPAPFADVGKVAIGTDPDGHPFALREPAKTEDDVGWSGPANSFCWAELYTRHVTSAVSFYKVVAGFTPTATPLPDGPYYLLERDGQPRAGIRTPLAGVQPGWFAWVRVPDVASTAATAQRLDATIVMPAANGRALLVDPWGCTLGLAQ